MPTTPISKVRPRMRNRYRALLAGSLGFAAFFIAGCGGSTGLLTGNQASTLQNELNQISSALSAGHCGAVRSGTQNLASEVGSLPTTVSEKLRQALDAEASQVATLAVQQCHPATTTPTTTTTTTTPTTSTPTTTTATTTSTTTTPTTTTPTTTTSTTTTPATTTTTPGNNGGTSGGGGLSGGAGGGNNGNGSGNG